MLNMNLYHLENPYEFSHNTYDSCVVCAESEEEAKNIHPSGFVTHNKDGLWYGTRTFLDESDEDYHYETGNTNWVEVKDIEKIKATFLGKASESIKKGVVIASFNAG